MKLLTTAAAIDTLGADFLFKTRLGLIEPADAPDGNEPKKKQIALVMKSLANEFFKTMEARLIEGTLHRITRGCLLFADYCRNGLEYGTLNKSIRGILTGLHFGYTRLSATQNGLLSRYALMICAGAAFLLSYWLW